MACAATQTALTFASVSIQRIKNLVAVIGRRRTDMG